nr:integrase, catalytic region, zinc finger, CCHC-type, peptidase aspartic, catalytic [Tanacetum cinerariifolium]
MLAPGNYVQWKSRIKRYIDTKLNHEHIHHCLKNPPYKLAWANKEVPIAEGSPNTRTKTYQETYKNVSQDIRDQLNAEAEAVQIILTGIDNDIYSTVDACPNACEMWKAFERLKQGESINVQDLETNFYWKSRKFTSLNGESLESYYSRFYKMMNELIKNQCDVTNHQVNVQFLLPLQPEWKRFVTLIKQSQKLKTASYHKLYDILKQHQNEVNEIRAERIERVANPLALEFGHVAKECQKPKRVKDPAYHREKMLLCKQEEAGIQLNAKQADWRDDTNDELEDQELEAHYMYMAQLQEVSLDATDSGPIFDAEPLQKIDQNDDDVDLVNERELIASLIKKLKCKIDDSKNRNKFLETSNKVLIEKLKGEIEDFKNKNKSLESSNNRFKEANDKLSETNKLLYDDFKKSEAELTRRNSVEYASKMEIECAQVRGDLISYKMESQKQYSGYLDPFIQNTIEAKFSHEIRRINAGLEQFHVCLNEEMVADLRYFNSLELEVDSLRSQLETQKTQFLNEIDRLSREYYYADHMNSILGVYTELDELLICNLVEIVLFIVNSGCSKHMTGNLKLLINFVEKFLGTVKFGNDQISPILGYGDLVQGVVTIKRVYYVEGLNYNLFSISQFCDADLEVAFRKLTCYIRDLKGNDLLTGSHGIDLYSITLQDINSPNPICLMAKATSSQAWLWHRRLFHLNFDTINLLSKNDIVVGIPKLKFIKDHLCSSYETPEVLIDFLRLVQRELHAQAEAIATACFTQNHSLVIPRHEKTPYHIINDQKLSVKFVYIFGSLCYIVRDGENLDKMKEKGDACIFVGYSTQSRAYRVFNKKTRVIVETIHVNFDKLPQMASDHVSFDPAPECQRMALKHDSLSLGPQCQENVTQADKIVTT